MIIGIDPGLSGGVALLDKAGKYIKGWDTPTLVVPKKGRGKAKNKTEYNMPGMAKILKRYSGDSYHIFIEESQAMPGQGVTSMFTIGLGFGIWLGIIAVLQIPYTRIRPAVWKKKMGLGKDKETSRLRALQLFPKAPLGLKKHHNRAEALLLAYYGLNYSNGG